MEISPKQTKPVGTGALYSKGKMHYRHQLLVKGQILT